MLDRFEDVMSVRDLQEALNIGSRTAYRLLKQQEIHARRVGKAWKIPKQSVIRFLEQGPQPKQGA